ncbi:MAG TPA: ABC transporter permease [Candidatus Limnocylindrales bacterium]|nr:ABC transporter permease [Candidatus Limnocylindrales bacterium]
MAVRPQELARQSHPRAPRGLSLPRPSERLVWGLLGFAIVLPLWEAVVQLGFVRRVTLSAPSLILGTAIRDFTSGYIWPHLWVSGQEYLLGLAAALLTGIPIGLLLGLFRRLNYVFDPWLSALYATPTIALVPLIIIVFGIGLLSKVVVVWLEAIFVVVISTMAGVRAADPRHLDIARSFGASRWLRFKSVILPSSVPFILTGIRLGTTRALVGVVVAEFLASNAGIGFYINFSGTTFRTDRVMLGVILLGLIGIAIGELIRTAERRVERWRPALR